MNAEVTAFMEGIQQPWQAEVCRRLREMVHASVPGVTERMQYRKPHFLTNGKYAAVITPSKDAVGFTIFNAADLDLPPDLFEGPPERKTIKIRAGQAPDYDLLAGLLAQAAGDL